MSTLKVDTYLTRGGASEIAIDKIKGVTAAGSMLVVAEGGTTTTNLQQGLTKVWCAWTGVSVGIYDSFNVSGMTDTSNVINLVSYTNGFNTAGHMAISYSANHNGGGLDDNSTSHLSVFSPNPGSAKFESHSNQNAAYQNCNISGDLA